MDEINIALEGCGRKVDFWLELDPSIQPDAFMLQHFKQGYCYEAELAWVLFHVLQEGDYAIDVGANIGFFTLFMSNLVGQSGKVWACEPGGNNLPTLRQHLKRNLITNVEVIERPIWCKAEPVTFYLNSDSRGGNALFDPANWWENEKSRQNPQPMQMQATTIDALTDFVPRSRIKLIKIDTEGAEQRILEGATSMLETCPPPFIVAEMNPHGLMQAGCTDDSLRDLMASFGYDMFFLHALDVLPAFVPRGVKVKHANDVAIINVMFSTIEAVEKAWSEASG
jgi:FkbM family methyltransferase